MHIKFIDSQDTTNYFSSYSFIIEDIDELAGRIEAQEVERVGLLHSDINPKSESLVMLFSYMISNMDLYVENLHNMKLLQPKDTIVKPLLIPYDFDFCGLVNADYAFTSKDLPGKTVRDRYYIGECRTNKEYKELFNHFISKKDDIYSLFLNCDLLSNETRNDAIEFLTEFFDIVENSKLRRKMIAQNCW
jgi:hypothetical protein